MEVQIETTAKEIPKANVTWVEKYRPGALQDLISHEGKIWKNKKYFQNASFIAVAGTF